MEFRFTIHIIVAFAQTFFRCDIIAFAGAISDGGGESNLTSETSGLWQRLIRKSAKIDGGWSRSAL